MMNVVDQGLVENYLSALETDEAEIQSAGEEYRRAQARVNVALRRYTALRDFLTETLGCTPYASHVKWPDSRHIDPSTRGRYRYAGMKVGDAIVEVFRSRRDTEPFPDTESFSELMASMANELTYGSPSLMSLDEIIKDLSEGGLGFPEPVSARAVNAALMRTTGIERHVTKGGQTRYGLVLEDSDSDDDPPDVDDLPFE